MKLNVKLSNYSVALSVICMVVLLVLMYQNRHDIVLYMIGAILTIGLILALFYMPVSISVDDRYLMINRLLRVKHILVKDIASVMLRQPTMAERRVCGSGGWFGYWGRFREPSIGNYFAYYGKASDCFIVTLKNGHKYLLGCENPKMIVDYINSNI